MTLDEKLDQILDHSLAPGKTVWSEQFVDDFEKNNGISLDPIYRSYLINRGNDYVRDDYYYFNPDFNIENEEGYYGVGAFFGFYDDVNNIEKQIDESFGLIPESLFPIADFLGDDFVCMDKLDGSIYFWLHDKINGLYKVEDDFSSFIMNFTYNENFLPDIEIKMTLSPELDAALKEAARKEREEG